jgi:hypothetical protein
LVEVESLKQNSLFRYYDEALNILEKVINISEKEICEILWKGCSPKLKLIIPYTLL